MDKVYIISITMWRLYFSWITKAIALEKNREEESASGIETALQLTPQKLLVHKNLYWPTSLHMPMLVICGTLATWNKIFLKFF